MSPMTSEQIQQMILQLQGTLSQQTGSSTQQSSDSVQNKPTGSSTQQKIGSSTQQPQTGPSAQSSDKKTLASYAKKLPSQNWCQTLAQKDQKTLALEAITKKEYDLANLKYNFQLTQKQPSAGPSNQLVIAPSQAITGQAQIKPTTPYVLKQGRFKDVVQIEPEFYLQTPNLTALRIFPSGFHFKPIDPRKTREYYEIILIHSRSIGLSRKKDPKDETVITHSSLQILNVLTPSQWGPDLNRSRTWDTELNFEPNRYNYWDYCEAWYNVFWDQNKDFKHSWFIYFTKDTKYKFPQWFLDWWDFFGPLPEIFPPIVQKAFELFKQKFNLNVEPAIPLELHYFSKLSASWIFSWHYKFSHDNRQSPILPKLQRVPFVRWWDKLRTNTIDSNAVAIWFKNNPEYLCLSEQSIFLNQRTRIQSTLAAARNKEDLLKQLSSMIKLLQNEEASSSQAVGQSSSSPASDEDDEDNFELFVDLSKD